MRPDDTIVALATTAGPAARAIVRTSGGAAFQLAARLGGRDLVPGNLSSVRLGFAQLEVHAHCLAFLGPRSHTGEDIVEYHLPGNPLLARLLIDSLIFLGARQAEPGEFSARAFFNGRIRLDQAEGVAAVISATSDRELSAARKLRAGELARRLEPALEALADLLALCELGIDFSEEDIVVISTADAGTRVAALRDDLRRLLAESAKLEQLSRPPTVALVGRPNAGKSTLLNALAGYRRAVSSQEAGTTRDAIRADIELPSGLATVVDLAGLAASPASEIDAMAIARAHGQAQQADVLVLVRDATTDAPDPPLPWKPDLIVLNKIDLVPSQLSLSDPAVLVSALAGTGLPALRQRLGELTFAVPAGSESLALAARHRQAVAEALDHLDLAGAALQADQGGEIVSLHLRGALDALGRILGVVSPDELLGRIFGRFCIGK